MEQGSKRQREIRFLRAVRDQERVGIQPGVDGVEEGGHARGGHDVLEALHVFL